MDGRTNETVQFHWRSDLDCLELRCLENSGTLWRHYCTGFEFLVPSTWYAEVLYRQRVYLVRPGTFLCVEPGFVLRVVRVLHPGALRVLSVDGDEQLKHLLRTPMRCVLVAPDSLEVHRSAQWVVVQLQHGDTPVQALRSGLEAFLVRIIEAAASSLERVPLQHAHARDLQLSIEPGHSSALSTELDDRRQFGTRSIRSFKDRVGLPPHAYDLCRRVALAKRSLRTGSTPSHVAIEYGFVDQSHLIRHFKRLVGVTPTQYLRGNLMMAEERRRPPCGAPRSR
jgi:hypothetical protein